MDRKIFKFPFTKSEVTRYQCPTCDNGLLNVQKSTFHFEQTASSKIDQEHPDSESGWIRFIYSGIFQCTNSVCGDVVSSSGTGFVEEEYSYNEDGELDRCYVEYFKPKYFAPHLKIFTLPKDTPESVAKEIDKSFSLLFADPSSSANHIRVALEYLLSDLGIKKNNKGSGSSNFIPLHRRIEQLPSKYEHIKDVFFAVKWLGNAGSHSNQEITLDDVFDLYEMIEQLLVEIFSNKSKKVKALAKKINKKQGP